MRTSINPKFELDVVHQYKIIASQGISPYIILISIWYDSCMIVLIWDDKKGHHISIIWESLPAARRRSVIWYESCKWLCVSANLLCLEKLTANHSAAISHKHWFETEFEKLFTETAKCLVANHIRRASYKNIWLFIKYSYDSDMIII